MNMTDTAVTVQSVGYVEIDASPAEEHWGDPTFPGPTEFVVKSEYAILPDAFVAAIKWLIDNPDDGGRCAACYLVGRIGYILHDDDDDPSGNGLRWSHTVLVQSAPLGPVVAICEDCSPGGIDFDRPLPPPISPTAGR